MSSPQAISNAPFWKMHGLGNRILVADLRAASAVLSENQAAAIAAHDDTGFDQLMALHVAPAGGVDALIRIYNTDGSRAGACGNGMRCVGRVIAEQGGRAGAYHFDVDGQRLRVDVHIETEIAVDMGRPRFEWQDIPLAEEFRDTRYIELMIGPIDDPILHSPAVVNMGNPHAVFWVDDIEAYDLRRFGPMLENHPIFPDRANITLANVTSRTSITMRTWERGAGLTQACGSAACATLVSAARLKRTERAATVTVPGGDLLIAWGDDDRVTMTGPAAHEYGGHLSVDAGGGTLSVVRA